MRLSVIAIAIVLAGCSTTEYTQYVDAHKAVAQAKADAEVARYEALAHIASSGDTSARIAAVMAIAMGGQGNANKPTQIAAPVPAGSTALQ